MQQLDETLVEDRTITNLVQDEDNLGWEGVLSCGHEVWFAIKPTMDKLKCAECINKLVDQNRELKAQQTKPNAH